MDVIVTLFYALFTLCIVYPPAEFVTAGFTIAQIFEGYLGSENTNFIGYHIKRISLTVLIHSALPLGYVFCLYCAGERGFLMLFACLGTLALFVLTCYLVLSWWAFRTNHPVVKALAPYAMVGGDWRQVACDFNFEYRGVEKAVVPLTITSKFIATNTWLIKVNQYTFNLVKQSECTLVATTTDSYTFSQSGEDEVQYVNVEVISTRSDVKGFSFRVTTTTLRDLQPVLLRPVRVPDHLVLLPTVVERFVKVFRQHIERNPVYECEQEVEQCIGCMQATADVKLDRRCLPPLVEPIEDADLCQQCNCRVLWCAACMARWWATRAGGAPAGWLAARGSCPLCRARFCLLDVRPARALPR